MKLLFSDCTFRHKRISFKKIHFSSLCISYFLKNVFIPITSSTAMNSVGQLSFIEDLPHIKPIKRRKRKGAKYSTHATCYPIIPFIRRKNPRSSIISIGRSLPLNCMHTRGRLINENNPYYLSFLCFFRPSIRKSIAYHISAFSEITYN